MNIIDAIAVILYERIRNPERMKKIEDLHDLIMQRPFPSGSIITNLVSKAFPHAPQSEVYVITQAAKESIAKQELICNLANQNVKSN